MKHSKETITLIGAGLVGSLLAVLLAKRGFKVEVFERRSDMRKKDISAGRSINLALANRGIHALQAADLMDQVLPILTTMKGRMIHDVDGRQNFQSYGQKPEEVIYSVSRGELNKICLNAAELTGQVTIHFNSKCQSVDLTNQTLVIENTQSSKLQTKSFTRLIGTDGSASAVRKSIHQINSKQHEIIPLEHSYKELRIPPAPNGDFQIERNALHIWPRGGYMLIALPNEDGSFTVTLFMPNTGKISFQAIDNKEKLKTFFTKNFPDSIALLPHLEEDFFNNPTGKLATIKCAPWHYKGTALIIGDAAHAIVPFHGQGMNCGFEDALALVQEIDKQDNNWPLIFENLDHNRKPNGDAIADMAVENYITMRDSVNDQKFLLKSALAFELEKRFSDYFCPRYSMVMFHRLDYAEVLQRGIIQEKILESLTEKINNIDHVDFKLAEKLIKNKLKKLELNP